MAVPKLCVNSTEIYFTIQKSYEVEINPSNGKKKWAFEIYGGPNMYFPSQFGSIIDELLAAGQAGTLTFTEADSSVPVAVKVSDNISISGIMQGVPVISLSVEEPGFGDETESDAGSITIYGHLGSAYFKGALSDYSETSGFIGETRRALTGRIIPSPTAKQYMIASLTIKDWRNLPMPKAGDRWQFTLSYRDAETNALFIRRGDGRIVNPPSLSGGALSVEIQENIGESGPWTADNAGGDAAAINGGGWANLLDFANKPNHPASDVTEGVI
ncbi:MAG: hypothetical protein LBS53_14095 [Synergistaceae bacterium]|jgi:hypothetical protein|nr:hypothetical protein [Synergistaceae bacterium]